MRILGALLLACYFAVGVGCASQNLEKRNFRMPAATSSVRNFDFTDLEIYPKYAPSGSYVAIFVKYERKQSADPQLTDSLAGYSEFVSQYCKTELPITILYLPTDHETRVGCALLPTLKYNDRGFPIKDGF